MKKYLLLFSALFLILAGCSDAEEPVVEEKPEAVEESKPEEEPEFEEMPKLEEEPAVEEEPEETESNSDFEDTDTVPEISEQAMDHAYDIIDDYEMVKDSHIKISEEDEEITLAIIVNSATNEEHAKDLGDNFARALASGVGIYSESDIESPSKDDLGELYNSYDLHIGVGTGPDDFIVQGAMVTSASQITW